MSNFPIFKIIMKTNYRLLCVGIMLLVGLFINQVYAQGQVAVDYTLAKRFPTTSELARLQTTDVNVARLFTGFYSNENLVKDDKSKSVFRTPSYVICVPIWSDRPNEHWVYFNRMFIGKEHLPVLQYLYKFEQYTADTVLMRIYNLQPEEKIYTARDWASPTPLLRTSFDCMQSDANCDILLTKTGENEFSGEMRTSYCSFTEPIANVAGYFIKIKINPQGVDVRVKFYDDCKAVIYEDQDPYFERLSYKATHRKIEKIFSAWEAKAKK